MRISDWSTDVCSSDLYDARITPEYGLRPQMPANIPRQFATIDLRDGSTRPATADESSLLEPDSLSGLPGAPKIVGRHEIGRASCRERVCSGSVDHGGRRFIKKKNKGNITMQEHNR